MRINSVIRYHAVDNSMSPFPRCGDNPARFLIRVRTRSETPTERIPGHPTTIVARHRLLAEVTEYHLSLRTACPRLLRARSSLT
jgi:hypothetical protein